VRAKEARGQGNADATSRIVLTESGSGGTHATITTDVKLSGKAAAMGGRMVGDVSAKMVDTFATNLAAMLEGPGDEPVEAADETPSPADDAPEAGTPTTVETAAVEADAGDAPSADGPSLPKPPPLREAPPPAADAELDALDLAGSVIAGRLSDPKTLAAVLGGAFAVGFLLGRRSS
jgi:hypothetical protein